MKDEVTIGERQRVEHYANVLRRTLLYGWSTEVPGGTRKAMQEALLYLEILTREIKSLSLKKRAASPSDSSTRSTTTKRAS